MKGNRYGRNYDKNEYDDTRSINLDVSTFRKDETHPSKRKKQKMKCK